MRRLALLIGAGVVAVLAFGLGTRAQDHGAHGGAPPTVAAAPAKKPAVPAQKQEPPKTTAAPESEEPRVAIDVPPEQQERIGLQTVKAVKNSVEHTLRTVGSVVADERKEAHVHTRVAGWIDEISVSAVGAPVKRGQVLYRLYAPELASTQAELVAARAQGELGHRITKAALERLSLWGVAPSEIEALRTGGPVKRALAFLSPADGYVVDKMAVKGMYVTPDMELYKIADLTHLWIIVTLYENELPLVKVGDEAEIALTVTPEKSMRAAITYIYPELDTATRTGRARVELNNAELAFKPGMFANVTIAKDLGEALIIPEDAVLFTGKRNLVFVKAAATRFEPKEVVLGPRTAGGFIVLSGIDAGAEVVVRASFLIDAESRLQAALQKGDAGGGHAGHGGGG